jgi:DNA polymerase (family 10)
MRNAEIAAALDELAALYEIDGAIQYRVIAYREAASVVRQSPVSISALAAEGKLTELPGIGATLEEKIRALLDTGEIPAAVKLKQKYPPSLVALTRLPGVGAKTVRRLYDELGISTLDELRVAAEGEAIRELKGLGAKVEENILKALAALGDDGEPADRRRLSDVLPVAEELLAALREHPASIEVGLAGSARRMTETCKDIDLIATADDPAALSAAFAEHVLLAEVKRTGGAGARALTHNGIPVDLRIVEPDQFGNLLQHFTGSKDHNVQLREAAVRKGLSVSEYGVTNTETGKVHRCPDEESVYKLLGYSYIEPELREGRGELDAAKKRALPELIEVSDIRGDLHCHTTLSDGVNTMEAMAAAAKQRGYSYLAVTDHSATHGFGNHVTEEQLAKRIVQVRKLNEKLGSRFRLLAGTETNILNDGSPDYPDELLAQLDWVVGSIHTSFRMEEKEMTERMIAAMENPYVDAIGHPTGRLILRRAPYGIDIERIVEAAVRTGTFLEINANPNRRDLNEHQARLAAEAGAMIVINSDAHRTRTFENMRYGVATARRAWLTAEKVANTRPWRELQKLRKGGRKAAAA